MSRVPKAAAAEVEERLAVIEYARGSIAHLAPGRDLASELIEDRRAEMRAPRADRSNKPPNGKG